MACDWEHAGLQAKRGLTGIMNYTNPGCISHNEIMELYKQYIDPEFTWQNFNIEEQAKVIKAPRSNNLLDTKRVRLHSSCHDFMFSSRCPPEHQVHVMRSWTACMVTSRFPSGHQTGARHAILACFHAHLKIPFQTPNGCAPCNLGRTSCFPRGARVCV